MPPRIPQLQCLRAVPPAAPSYTLPIRPLSSTPSVEAAVKRKNKSQNPYVAAQAAARKAANLARQEVLRKQRAAAEGDPVKGITTPFLQSFDTGREAAPAPDGETEDTSSGSKHEPSPDDALILPKTQVGRLNNFLSAEEVNERLLESFLSAAPLAEQRREWVDMQRGPEADQNPAYDPQSVSKSEEAEASRSAAVDEQRRALHRKRHENAVAAIARIVDLGNGSSSDRTRLNTQRCIDTFGRHNTDATLQPRPIALPLMSPHVADPQAWVRERLEAAKAQRQQQKKERGGPDTGSSEVQIGILTAKIRTLSQVLETRGRGDKVGKRDLRLLVHKRQKLLKYLWRKERGGPRWQHCVETLGLTDGTWKGEITL